MQSLSSTLASRLTEVPVRESLTYTPVLGATAVLGEGEAATGEGEAVTGEGEGEATTGDGVGEGDGDAAGTAE